MYIPFLCGSTAWTEVYVLLFYQANLRACNEELRRHVQELKHEVEYLKQAIARAESAKVRKTSITDYKLKLLCPCSMGLLNEDFVKKTIWPLELIQCRFFLPKPVLLASWECSVILDILSYGNYQFSVMLDINTYKILSL